jgi:GDP-L-fucose synthase
MEMINKKILITGCSGFLGRHLNKKLRELGYEIYLSNSKIGNLKIYNELFYYNNVKFDYIIHLAAKTKAGDYCLYHKGEQWIDNQLINTNILQYWFEYQPQAKMIAMGTSCSYSPDLPLIENNYMLGTPDEGLYTYAMTKRMLLNGLQSLNHQYGMTYNYLIPSTLYGPDFEVEDSHFIFDLIKKIINGKNTGEPVTLWGHGYQKRELIFVKDAVDIIIKSLDVENQILNLGTGQDHTIKEFAKKICDIVGYDENTIKYDETKYVGVLEKKLNTDKLLSIFPDITFTNLEDGLNETINYYKTQTRED